MILLRLTNLFFVFVLTLTVLHGQPVFATPLIPPKQADADADDDEYEDEEDYKNNPWQIDERKLFAAKKFQLSRQFAVKIKQLDNVCGLDKKQQLKLKIASKGATDQSLEKFVEQWEEQLQRYAGFEQGNDQDDDDEDGEKKKKVKKKKKRFVVTKVEEIDGQVLQMLESNFFGGQAKPDVTDVELWSRTVGKVLDGDQKKKFDAYVEKLKLAQREARADSFVTKMRLELALSDSQLDDFDKLVRPAFLKKDVDVNWQYDSMATLYLGGKYNKSKMKKLLSEDQYLILTLKLKPAEGYGYMLGDNNNNNRNVRVEAVEPEHYVAKVFGAALEGLASLVEGVADSIEGALE